MTKLCGNQNKLHQDLIAYEDNLCPLPSSLCLFLFQGGPQESCSKDPANCVSAALNSLHKVVLTWAKLHKRHVKILEYLSGL